MTKDTKMRPGEAFCNFFVRTCLNSLVVIPSCNISLITMFIFWWKAWLCKFVLIYADVAKSSVVDLFKNILNVTLNQIQIASDDFGHLLQHLLTLLLWHLVEQDIFLLLARTSLGITFPVAITHRHMFAVLVYRAIFWHGWICEISESNLGSTEFNPW